jgi:hypothetical protein
MADIAALENRLPPEAKEDIAKSDISLKERFFRYFQHEITGTPISPHTVLFIY